MWGQVNTVYVAGPQWDTALASNLKLDCAGPVWEDTAGREDSPQRHPLRGASHDQRQEVPLEDLQVRWHLCCFRFAKDGIILRDLKYYIHSSRSSLCPARTRLLLRSGAELRFSARIEFIRTFRKHYRFCPHCFWEHPVNSPVKPWNKNTGTRSK